MLLLSVAVPSGLLLITLGLGTLPVLCVLSKLNTIFFLPQLCPGTGIASVRSYSG